MSFGISDKLKKILGGSEEMNYETQSYTPPEATTEKPGTSFFDRLREAEIAEGQKKAYGGGEVKPVDRLDTSGLAGSDLQGEATKRREAAQNLRDRRNRRSF